MSESELSPTKSDSAREEAEAAYNEVVLKARLQDIRLISSSFDVKPAYYLARDEQLEGAAGKPVRHSISMHAVMPFYDAEQKLLGGRIGWALTAKQSRSLLLKLEASYLITYRNVPDVGDVHSEAFLKRVGKFAAYPYFRNLVSQISWASAAELPILPVLKDIS